MCLPLFALCSSLPRFQLTTLIMSVETKAVWHIFFSAFLAVAHIEIISKSTSIAGRVPQLLRCVTQKDVRVRNNLLQRRLRKNETSIRGSNEAKSETEILQKWGCGLVWRTSRSGNNQREERISNRIALPRKETAGVPKMHQTTNYQLHPCRATKRRTKTSGTAVLFLWLAVSAAVLLTWPHTALFMTVSKSLFA